MMKRLTWERSKAWIELTAGAIAIVSVVVSASMYMIESPTRKREAVFNAWGIVAGMEGKRSDGGRSEALRQLRTSGENLAGVVLDGSIFRALDLSNTTLTRASLRDVEFTGCSLKEVDLTRACLADAHMIGCNLTAGRLVFAQLDGAVLADCILDLVSLQGARGDSRTSFNGASMRQSVWSNAVFRETIVDNADLSGASITEVCFDDASFQRVNAGGWQWTAVRATSACLQNVHGSGCQFMHDTVLAQARLDRSILHEATFDHVDLRGASFFAAELQGTVFRDCDLSGADLSSADLTGVTFLRCNTEGMVLRMATGLDDGSFRECRGRLVAPPMKE